MGTQGKVNNLNWSVARQMAEPITSVIERRKEEGVIKTYTFAGSYRRNVEIVNDIDIILFTEQPESEWESILRSIYFSGNEIVVASSGSKKATIILANGLQVDLLMAKPNEEGSMLLYFTGSPFFNIALRAKAKKMGLLLNERGLYENETEVCRNTEQKVLKRLHLEYIPVAERSIAHSDWSAVNKLFAKYRIKQ